MTMPPPMVTASGVVVRTVPYYIDEIGNCASKDTVTLMPQVAGRVEAAHFTEGKDVKKGDVIYTIDPRPFEAVLAQTEAALKENEANLEFAKSEFERVEALQGTNAVSKTEYDQKKSALAVAVAHVGQAKANVDNAKLNLEYCTIRSPLDGRTGMRMVDPGNIVKANETGLVMIQSFDPIYVDFTIPEDRLAEVRANMANGSLKTLVTLPGGNGIAPITPQPPTQPPTMQAAQAPTTQPETQLASTEPTTRPVEHIGALDMVDNSVLTGTGTVRLRATVPNADRYFWPGQFVHVRLLLHENSDALLVPSQAIQVGQQGPYVYVVKHDDQKNMDIAEMRQVVQGQIQGDLIVIEKGLNPTDKVITTGQLMVVPNAPVTVAAPPSQAQVAEAKS
jgi:multidrug efflux system membrane fusion protein